MKKAAILNLAILLMSIACSKAQEFEIEILDDAALELIDPNAEIKVIGEGFTWTEGPVYIDDGNYLLFSDIPNNTVFKIDAEGDLSTYLKPSGYLGKSDYGNEPGSNGLLLNKKRNWC
ncbi:hypothetical protein [Maribacter halichondriae]|uniref:hypothetical protein n=1 Tax=Maribacter halichondriae TaxID=2980554 RepID=UPI0023599A5B|nr:hypothetical protein [Maribacter sp. Hal144]